MLTLKRSSLQSKQSKRSLLVVLCMVVVFGGVGVYLLRPSKAAVDPGALSLAPASYSLEKGQVVNVAVNVGTGYAPNSDVVVSVRYPSSLSLQGVRDACPNPGFTQPRVNMATTGTVEVHCQRSAGNQGGKTLAMLVFTASQNTGTASITIDGSPAVSRIALGTSSTAGVRSRQTDTDTVTRVLPTACGLTSAGKTSCTKPTSAVSRSSIVKPDGTILGTFTPMQFHAAYHMPCATGGKTTQAVCAQPSSYGPATVDIVQFYKYSTSTADLENDLSLYDQEYALPNCTVANGCLSLVNATGGSDLPTATVSEFDSGIMTAIVSVHSMCQTCKIRLVVADNLTLSQASKYAISLGDVAVVNNWIDLRAKADRDPDSWYNHNTGMASIWPASAYVGTTWFVGPGLNGYPASIPGNVVVAGSFLAFNHDDSRFEETTTAYDDGGCSPDYPAPAWQTGLPNWSALGCGNHRAYADIVANADAEISVPVHGVWQITVGTDMSQALVGGMFGLAGSVPASMTGEEVLYKNSNSSNTYDVTGSDYQGLCLTSAVGYCHPGPGFDIPSGLGAPNGVSLFAGPSSGGGGGGKTGDINNDGKVNIQDLAQLLINFGKNTSTGDLNNDGKINIQDLALLLINFGK